MGQTGWLGRRRRGNTKDPDCVFQMVHALSASRTGFCTATRVIFDRPSEFDTLLGMAHFPQPHSRVRAPRVRIPSNEPVKLSVNGKKVSATLHRLSLTGGLVLFHDPIGDLSLAEVVLATESGPVKALVEFLKKNKEAPSARPFRFIALDDPDYNRLVTVLQSMRKRGLLEK
jgi:hypothetical protein